MFFTKLSIASALSLVATVMSSAAAQENSLRECFSVISPPTVAGGQSILTIFGINAMNGSMLINKCNGQTWFLARSVTTKGSFAYRWFPIGTMNDEATFSEQKTP